VWKKAGRLGAQNTSERNTFSLDVARHLTFVPATMALSEFAPAQEHIFKNCLCAGRLDFGTPEINRHFAGADRKKP
jgi:hypothetical protein